MRFPRINRTFVLLFCIALAGINLTLRASSDFTRVRRGKILIEEPVSQRATVDTNNASNLMDDRKELRPLAKFITTPRLSKKRAAINVRWTAINMVKSAASNSIRRNTIRVTWGEKKLLNDVRIETIFIVGRTDDSKLQKKIENENRVFGDILQIDLLDNYTILPDKTLAGMQWVAENAPASWIYSSVDDDFVLHPVNFIRFIDKTLDERHIYTRQNTSVETTEKLPIICIYSFKENDRVDRRFGTKWYVSPDDYSPNNWPTYCRGGWYTMPVSLASELHAISRRTTYLHLDDVWITGILRTKIEYISSDSQTQFKSKMTIIPAPLSKRNESELWKRVDEKDLKRVIVSHVWGNIENREVAVGTSLLETWKKWLPSIEKSIAIT